MAKQKDKKSKNFKMDADYKGGIIEARRQEMEQILPGFYTQVDGVIIPSKPITTFSTK